MAGKTIAPKSAAITAATATGYVTIAATTGWYKNAKGAMTAAGQPNRSITITEILSATQMGVRIEPDDHLGPAAHGPNYGRSDVSLYNGGVVIQHEQFIFNIDDLPLS